MALQTIPGRPAKHLGSLDHTPDGLAPLTYMRFWVFQTMPDWPVLILIPCPTSVCVPDTESPYNS